MQYIIDGYNLFFRTKGVKLPVEVNRKRFVASLLEVLADRNIHGMIVFDSKAPDTPVYASTANHGDINVVFSPSGKTADDYILEYLSTLTNPRIYTLVTSDRFLATQARELDVYTMDVSHFCQLLYKRGPSYGPAKPQAEAPHQIARYLNLWEHKEK